ncbi:DUF2207 domain-containing protein [Candidatus Saccharibacteria bacterium]|nr:MAG: DUF2207 domain-containing protein [Candidatus Saccharibacteria bacterium]
MKRLGLFLSAALLLSGFFAPVTHAAVDDFTITDFQADYYLARDNDNRSRLKTVERITAEFPAANQNHGIERAIPKSYDNHPTHLEVQTVTDGSGTPLNFTTYESNGNEVVRIGDANTYVHGTQRYMLTYEQRDVTLRPNNRDINEFYWDTNGTDWRVPFDHVTARVHMSAKLASELTGEASCYVGARGSNERCDITKATEGDVTTFTIPASRDLAAGENVTFAIGFQDGTFAAYQPTLWERVTAFWGVVNIIGWIAALAAFLLLLIQYVRRTARSRELGTIIPEYIPPKDASLTVASRMMRIARSVMTAQLLDLAVRHYIKIYEVKEKTIFSPAQYEIEIIKDLSDLRWEEQEILKDMFDDEVIVGARLNLKKLRNSYSFAQLTINNDKDLTKLMNTEYGLQEMRPENKQWFRRAALIILVSGILLFSLPLMIVAFVAFICSFIVYSWTDKGLALRRYLEGLKLYIGVAEQERIKMLQSPEGAEKVASVVDIADRTEPAQLVKLYERVLPYAVLFGQEKEWNKQLGSYYETNGSSPDWYTSSSGAYNAAIFTTAMNSFSTSTSTYTSSSSSSSSGSGGGGSSGGGGGGGGGGGW